MGFQLKHVLCSKIFATGHSELGNVVCQMENQLNPEKTTNLKLYGKTPKVYPPVKFLEITFDSQLTFKKHFEEILDSCNARYHRLRLLTNKKWEPSPSTLGKIYKQCIRPIFEYGSLSTITTSDYIISKIQWLQNEFIWLPFVYQNAFVLSCFMTPLAFHM